MKAMFNFYRKQGAFALAFLLLMGAIVSPRPVQAAETPTPNKVYPKTVDWASMLTPEAYSATPEEWKDFNYNDLLHIPEAENHGWDVWSYVENYHRGDGLILRAAELYFDSQGIGLEQIQQYRRDVTETCLAAMRVKIEPTLLAYLPDRGEEYREYNIWNKQEDVDMLLGSIPGLAESNTDCVIFWNDGGWSYEPGIVTYQGKKYWVITLDRAIDGGRGVHDMIQTLLNVCAVETMNINAGILYEYAINLAVEKPDKLSLYRSVVLKTGKPYSNWGWPGVLGVSRNETFNQPLEFGVPTDDRPIWTPQCADAFYSSKYDQDWSSYLSEATYYLSWFAYQPRTVALDSLGNEIDIVSALVRDLRGLKPGESPLPARASIY